MKKLIALVDGPSLLYRTYFAQKAKTITVDPALVTRMVLNKINNLAAMNGVEETFVAWEGMNSLDSRKALLPDYKGTRSSNEDVHPYVDHFIENVVQHDVTSIRHDDLEADDTIAEICRLSSVKDNETEVVIIASTDKDLRQLAIYADVFNPYSNEKAHTKGWAAEIDDYSMNPKDIPFYLALQGDKSDNIPPACSGIGHKTANDIVAFMSHHIYDLVDCGDLHRGATSYDAYRKYREFTESERKAVFNFDIASGRIMKFINMIDMNRLAINMKLTSLPFVPNNTWENSLSEFIRLTRILR